MNTLTIAALVVCATMACASALPGEIKTEQEAKKLPVAPAEELLQGAESRGYNGGGGGYHGGGGGGRYHGGGGGRYHGGGGNYHHGHGYGK